MNHCKWNTIHIWTWIPSFQSSNLILTPLPPTLNFKCTNIVSSFEQPESTLDPPDFHPRYRQATRLHGCIQCCCHAGSPGTLRNRFLAHITVTRVTNEPPSHLSRRPTFWAKPQQYACCLDLGVGSRGMLGKVCVVCCVETWGTPSYPLQSCSLKCVSTDSAWIFAGPY